MRTADRPVPSIDVHRPPVEPFPAILHIGVARQPVAAYVYDDHQATYDAPGNPYVYDDATMWPYDRMDLYCRFHGLRIESGHPNGEGVFSAGNVELTLDNRDGALSQYDAMGRLIHWAPGTALDIWCDYAGEPWWLFSGRVTAWRERADGTVDVEAFDTFADLNDKSSGRGTPVSTANARGAHRRDPRRTRLPGPTRLDAGLVTLHSWETVASPLEELQAVARSDGGFVFVDADGTIVYRDRLWLGGRADQTAIPTFSDNHCGGGTVIVWEPDVTTDDDVLVNKVRLENVADVVVTADDETSIVRHGPRALPLPRYNDQWITPAEGQALANYLIARRAGHYLPRRVVQPVFARRPPRPVAHGPRPPVG